jgi:thiol-disulfide isomerase/thioredoxin
VSDLERGGGLAPGAPAAARAVSGSRAEAARRPLLGGVLALGLLLAGACFVPEPKPSENRAMLGQLAPELALEWLDGAPDGALSDLRGKVVLLEFWRTWCEPCLGEVPYLNELHGRYQADGLVVVGVTSEEQDLVRAAREQAAIAFPLARSADPAAERYWGISAVPRAFLVDREGALVWVGHPGALEEGRLRELLYGP